MEFNVAIVGATGAVGREISNILSEREPWFVPILITVLYCMHVSIRGCSFSSIRFSSSRY